MKSMTNERYQALCEEMQQLANKNDIELAHIRADEILCEVLNELDYAEIVELYHDVGKWYA